MKSTSAPVAPRCFPKLVSIKYNNTLEKAFIFDFKLNDDIFSHSELILELFDKDYPMYVKCLYQDLLIHPMPCKFNPPSLQELIEFYNYPKDILQKGDRVALYEKEMEEKERYEDYRKMDNLHGDW